MATRNKSVFINCPFSSDYNKFFEAIVFTVMRAGFLPRCAREVADSSQVRFDKICKIIAACDYGIHDISKADLDVKTRLARFNMPLELGLFLAAKKFGDNKQKQKNCLILDSHPHRYEKFISDIKGHDIESHGNSVRRIVSAVTDWLRHQEPKLVPGGTAILEDLRAFNLALPKLSKKKKVLRTEILYADYVNIAAEWMDSGSNGAST